MLNLAHMRVLRKVGRLIGLFTEVVVLYSYMEEKPDSYMGHMQMLQEVGWLVDRLVY